MVTPAPAPELDALAVLAGSWQCEARALGSPFATEHAFKATLRAQQDLDGFWYVARWEERRSRVHPVAARGEEYWGWDAAHRRYLVIGVDRLGIWATGSSAGWEGDKLVWTGQGTMNGQSLPFRSTFLKRGRRELGMTEELQLEKGKWTTIAEATCKR